MTAADKLMQAIRAEPTELIAKWRVLELIAECEAEQAAAPTECDNCDSPRACSYHGECLRPSAKAAAPKAEAVVWRSPEERNNLPGLVWLRERDRVFLGYLFSQPFREYRDTDGFYTGQQDAEEYWARYEDGDQCEPDGWCDLQPPGAAPQPPAEREPLTNAQIAEASREAHIAFALCKHQTFEHALTRAIERAHGIGTQPKQENSK